MLIRIRSPRKRDGKPPAPLKMKSFRWKSRPMSTLWAQRKRSGRATVQRWRPLMMKMHRLQQQLKVVLICWVQRRKRKRKINIRAQTENSGDWLCICSCCEITFRNAEYLWLPTFDHGPRYQNFCGKFHVLVFLRQKTLIIGQLAICKLNSEQRHVNIIWHQILCLVCKERVCNILSRSFYWVYFLTQG